VISNLVSRTFLLKRSEYFNSNLRKFETKKQILTTKYTKVYTKDAKNTFAEASVFEKELTQLVPRSGRDSQSITELHREVTKD
jgi:hypothetical protein